MKVGRGTEARGKQKRDAKRNANTPKIRPKDRVEKKRKEKEINEEERQRVDSFSSRSIAVQKRIAIAIKSRSL